MMRRLYLLTRDLHLYLGLFLGPFILVFSISVFYLVHGLAYRREPDASDNPRAVTNVALPADIARLQGRARVDALRPVLHQLGVRGEIDFVRHIVAERRLVIPVRLPDHDSVISLDYAQGTATVTDHRRSIGDALVYLHKMPGPHNAEVRGNSGLIRAWRVFADATAYVLLFITISGVYLWVALRAERRMGLTLLFAGAATLLGLVYVVAA